MSKKYVQAPTQYLAGSGVIIGATSTVVQTFTDIYGNAITNFSNSFGDKGYITFEPDTNNEEGATFTGLTTNANGTTTLTGLASILAQSPYTETSGLIRAHAGGTKVVITDNVSFWNTFGNKANDETLTGRWGTAVAPTSGNDLVNKTYADGLAIAGAPDSSTTTKGIGKVSVAPVSPTSPIFVGQNDPQFVNYFAETGAANAYVITPSPSIGAYATGQRFSFKAANANTTASTININGLGAKTIKKNGSVDLIANDIIATQIVAVEYDGANFQMQNPGGNGQVELAGAQSIAGLKTFSTLPQSAATPSNANDLATKTYTDTKEGAVASIVGATIDGSGHQVTKDSFVYGYGGRPYDGGASASSVICYSDSASTPTTVVAKVVNSSAQAGGYGSYCFFVKSGNYYKISPSYGTGGDGSAFIISFT